MNLFQKILYTFYHPRKIFFYFLGINESYSQTGEDIIIRQHLGKLYKTGTYIDVGANQPIHLNNTYLFYKAGWRGVNIEPNKQLIENFNKKRSKDINLNVAVGPGQDGKKSLEFFVFDAHTLSTTDKETAKKYENLGHTVVEQYTVPVITLEEIFIKHSKNNYVDILSIDVEGFDYEVLKSNDRNKYHAKYIILETIEYSLDNTGKKLNSQYDEYLGQFGYEKLADTYINTIYYKK